MTARPLLVAASVFALIPGLALAAAAPPRAAEAARPFVPPGDGLVLTREVRRPLSNGEEVVARRSYAITFRRDGDGFIVDGHQIAIEVDAPANLAMLAEIERRRSDSGMFPMRLDAQGIIVSEGGAGDAAAVAAATGEVARMVAHSALPASDRADVSGFVQQIKARGDKVQWPRDLFRPAPGEHRETHDFALPQGGLGHVVIAIDADVDAPGDLPRRLERTVTTGYAGSERVTREIFQMERVPVER